MKRLLTSSCNLLAKCTAMTATAAMSLGLFWGFTASRASAQEIPFSRQGFHAQVDKAQLSVCAADGTKDDKFTPYPDNPELNKLATKAITKQVDKVQKSIEKSDLDNNSKIRFLRGLYELLYAYKNAFLSKDISGAQLANTVKGYEDAMALEIKHEDISPILKANKAEVAALLAVNFSFKDNPGKPKFQYILLDKEIASHPDKALYILSRNSDFPATDSVVSVVAKRDADAVYNYAASYTDLGEAIRKSQDPLVNLISRIASARNQSGQFIGRQLMPFLDEISAGNLDIESIEAKMDDPVAYFKLLVQTEIHYAARVMKKDTPMAMQQIQDKIHQVGVDYFINKINGLHEKPNQERYACLKPLSALDLYYLTITSEDIIYTSSYVNGKDYGVYNLLWQKAGKGFSSDSLLMKVYFDKYKKWIKMAANYNTLDDFLGRMQPKNAQQLMLAFVRGLDKGVGKDSLEDAVDVAGSYASIDDPKISELVLHEVQSQLQQARASGNTKKFNIYDILNTLFLSMNPKNNIDLSASLGIGPVYFMPIQYLKDSSGRIIIQQFTYGDEDGRANYGNFMNAVSGAGWKSTSNQYWSTVSSTSGTPITIYTNKPLDELQALDDKAQQELNSYLEENDIHPTMVLHRGHSYYLESTIDQLVPSARVVLLGSCGSFQSLSKVLNKSPEAQIISSKQTGVGNLNLTLIMGMLNTLKKGEDLNWVKMWGNFSKQLSGDNRFIDYVPPYENLGAVFYMAYRKLQDKEQEKQDSIEADKAGITMNGQ
ncbi:hypothetical protein SAMN05192529_1175 [Arachidicoccus rhizosphaerae]|jgi:hypothetical protein|uniref:CHAT domain-containing protein n=1 Tax=Arachidicoccus rhizosphaerae TaxID=551991 RepID=A0A1H4AX42_9BACT|nr:hypothetical protein [Arachidicoccus rhizosphaerae]SEA40425.1 hypothetical protein SAMN05192529_1175 [Arachidicoccus rhizosphaerae]